ncbi:MAG: RNA-binding protein [Acidimicrobiales bacterium]
MTGGRDCDETMGDRLSGNQRWVVDGNNVMGSRPDGWWNDRPAAMARLTDEIARWCWTHDDEVVLVFDGAIVDEVAQLAGGNLSVRFARSSRRDAADDTIAGMAVAGDIVVTADRGLLRRLSPGVTTLGPRRLLDLVRRPR